jgi:hypothetical protein
MGPLDRLKDLMERDEGLMNLVTTYLDQGEGTGSAQDNVEALLVSEPVADRIANPIAEPFAEAVSEPQANIKDPVSEHHSLSCDSIGPTTIHKNHKFTVSCGHKVGDNHLTETKQVVDCSRNIPKLHLEGLRMLQDKYDDDARSDMTSENRLTAVPTSSFFTPAITMARFFLKYVPGDAIEEVNAKFYAGGKFWNRTWDL